MDGENNPQAGFKFPRAYMLIKSIKLGLLLAGLIPPPDTTSNKWSLG